jgi:hypothetical protein
MFLSVYTHPHDNIRLTDEKVSPTILYEGAPPPDDDPADYFPRNCTIKGEVLA